MVPRLLSCLECIAGFHGSFVEAPAQTGYALLRRTVRKALGRDMLTSLFLQTIVADGRRGPQTVFYVPGIENVARRSVTPHAGEAIGLKLQTYRKLVGGSR